MTKDSVKVPPLKETKAPDAPNPDLKADPGTSDVEEKAPKAAPKQLKKVLHVVAKREGFRRAGFSFGSERTRLVADDLTAEQIKQLKEEPMLVVTESTEEV